MNLCVSQPEERNCSADFWFLKTLAQTIDRGCQNRKKNKTKFLVAASNKLFANPI